ncbi:hypothetical protein PHMEG_00025713 [Phytophthora megakarya]|uniref:Uncharacterized protein n=1 Tax=Phytophthora megakarya TaxID=4795 RepID=A0A225VC75_9STRA|nr:hypothetical protein PHMEG_00025713 [Phytophthora megakarya]
MNAVFKGHEEMYDRIENRLQLAHRSNEVLTKEVNHARSKYLVGVQAFKKSHDNRRTLLLITNSSETTITLKLRERNRDLMGVKRLENANSALGTKI